MKLAAILALLPAMAAACSIERRLDFARLEVRSNSVVAISYRGNPLVGATVEIYGSRFDLPLLATTTTDEGAARISGLREGNYTLSVSFLGRSVVWEEFHVAPRPTSRAQDELKYSWDETPYPVLTAAGVFLRQVKYIRESGNTTRWEPEPSIGLTLVNVTTNQRHTTESDADGTFDFGPVPVGVYLLRAQTRFDPPALLVEITPKAERRSLRVRINGGGGCGEPLVE